MIEDQRGDKFSSGSYHRLRAQELDNIPGMSMQNRNNLYRGYRHTEGLIDQLVNEEREIPLIGEDVRVLLMGIEGYRTAETFTDFIHSRNPHAVVTIADLSPHPLIQCIENGVARLPNVNIVQADTTALQFPDNSFNLIETDGLLQFLSPKEKRQAIAQWYRVLRPGGVITTRDRFASIDQPRDWDDLNNWKQQLHRRLGVHSYPTSLEVMRYLFKAQGFSTIFEYMYPDAARPDRRVLQGIAARKPL